MSTLSALLLEKAVGYICWGPQASIQINNSTAGPHPQGRVGQAGAVFLDISSVFSWPDFWKAYLPQSFRPKQSQAFLSAGSRTQFRGSPSSPPLSLLHPSSLLHDSRSEDKYWGFCPLPAWCSCLPPAASTNCPLGALCRCLEFRCVGEGLGLGPELQAATSQLAGPLAADLRLQVWSVEPGAAQAPGGWGGGVCRASVACLCSLGEAGGQLQRSSVIEARAFSLQETSGTCSVPYK